MCVCLSLSLSLPPHTDGKTSLAMRARIRGVIDHHALSEAFATAGPLFMDVRPWGSACSIVCHMYIRLGELFY